MQSRIGCICMLFQMSHQMPARTDAKTHWLHFYAFTPKGVFRCFLKSPAWTDGKSHWLHLNDFSPEGVFKCFLKSPAWIDAKLQMVAFVRFFQLSPQIVCLNRCKVALIAFVCFSPEWVFKCVLKLPACTDAKSHWLHLYAFSNVSSNCLPEQMQIRIGCICTLFHLSEFSDAF